MSWEKPGGKYATLFLVMSRTTRLLSRTILWKIEMSGEDNSLMSTSLLDYCDTAAQIDLKNM